MKKLFSMMMILLIIAGMTVSAFAANSRTFTVSCTGAEGVTVPTETSTFQIAADSNNPDTSKMITITHQEAGRYLIDFPAFTAAGVYKYAITQKEGDTVVELDEFRAILNSYTKPLVEVRDSL